MLPDARFRLAPMKIPFARGYAMAGQQLDWQHLWNQTPCPMAVVDDAGRIRYGNGELLRLCGERLSEDPSWVSFIQTTSSREHPGVQRIGGKDYRVRYSILAEPEGWILYLLEPVAVKEKASPPSSSGLDLDTLIEHSYDCIYITDQNGITLHTNSAIERLTGIPKEYYIGKDVRYLEKRGILKKSVTLEVLRTGKTVSTVQENKHGKVLIITGSPIFDEEGRIVRVVINIRDVTELNRLRDELDETRKRSEKYRKELSALRKLYLKEEPSVVMSDVVMQQAYHLAMRVAGTDATVLLLGESGVGKEVFARLIHKNSSRYESGSFITVNCGAIPEELIESELFGYEGGAFTGARKEGKPGMFEMAENGTLLLDEIGELPLSMQVKLLRVLQEKKIRRVGGVRSIPINVRIIAATNRDLKEMVRRGRFREDLYYRISVVPIEIPPLRRRRKDIKPLLIHYLDKFNRKYRRSCYFVPEAIERLERYDWPGNVRELANMVERLVITCPEDAIRPEHIPEIREDGSGPSPADGSRTAPEINGEAYDLSGLNRSFGSLSEMLSHLERTVLAEAYRRHHSSYQVAKHLGISQSAAMRKAYKYGIREKGRP